MGILLIIVGLGGRFSASSSRRGAHAGRILTHGWAPLISGSGMPNVTYSLRNFLAFGN